MPLPPLRPDGTLPPGVHPATMVDVFARFPAITTQRQALNNALASAVATITRLDLAERVVLDGSFVSAKPDPEDVDMVVLTPGVYQLTGERVYAAAGIDLNLLDIQFAHDAVAFQGWIAFFSNDRNLVPKGVVLLIP